ncbi:hypothetical protein GCM10010191_36500 [Actinomadura vinacea]|uniref:Lytic transglycosylase domain-containing protein n=1 Tax=Actinomadura vinacea TaxID=115336 RepID=A0ABN3J5E1_9ACTN
MKVAGSPFATQAMGPMGRPGDAGGPGGTHAMQAVQDEPHGPGAAVGLAEPPPSPYPGPGEPMGPMGPAGPADELAAGPGTHGPRGPRGTRRSGGGKGNGMKIVAMAAGAAVVVGGGAVAALALTGGDEGKAKVSSAPQADAPKPPPVDPYVEVQQRRKLAYERATRAARTAPKGKKPVLMPKGEPIPTKKPKPEGGDEGGVPSLGSPVPAGVAQAYAKSVMDDPGTQFGCLQKLWNKESGWNYKAANPSSGAYGIPQALPGSKMSSAGADWRTNYKTQIKWGLGYIEDRYGSPCKAWGHSESVGWY